MQPEPLLEALLSKDAYRIWEASSRANGLWDRPVLRWLAGHRAAIRAATNGVPLGGLLRPNEVILNLALKRMEVALGGLCFCQLYGQDFFADPKREAADGFVTVVSMQDDLKQWKSYWQVRCNTCDAVHDIVQDDGWHFPTWRWKAA